ncbi:MAG: hypothetical protein ACWGO1_11495 [Anaerolineales bacterium]
MSTAEYELGYLKAALSVLEDYLLSEDVYWSLIATPPAGSPEYPTLTLGTLFLMLQKLKARQLTPDQQAEMFRIESEINRSQSQWKSAWEKKAVRGFAARLSLWRNFLEEYRQDPENNIDRYPYEVNRRVMMAILKSIANPPSAELELLDGLDRVLRTVFVTGEFVWEPELARSFPASSYWYLYGHLRGERV